MKRTYENLGNVKTLYNNKLDSILQFRPLTIFIHHVNDTSSFIKYNK